MDGCRRTISLPRVGEIGVKCTAVLYVVLYLIRISCKHNDCWISILMEFLQTALSNRPIFSEGFGHFLFWMLGSSWSMHAELAHPRKCSADLIRVARETNKLIGSVENHTPATSRKTSHPSLPCTYPHIIDLRALFNQQNVFSPIHLVLQSLTSQLIPRFSFLFSIVHFQKE